MEPTSLTQRVNSIRATLQAIESELDRGRLPAEALGDFKSAVDDIRLRVWNIMAASKAQDYRGALERFRLRRAADITRAVAEGLRSGEIRGHHPEVDQLRETTSELRRAIDAVAAPGR